MKVVRHKKASDANELQLQEILLSEIKVYKVSRTHCDAKRVQSRRVLVAWVSLLHRHKCSMQPQNKQSAITGPLRAQAIQRRAGACM